MSVSFQAAMITELLELPELSWKLMEIWVQIEQKAVFRALNRCKIWGCFLSYWILLTPCHCRASRNLTNSYTVTALQDTERTVPGQLGNN